MKTFHCNFCQALLFFENTRCLTCGHVLAYVPAREALLALDPRHGDTWAVAHAPQDTGRFRLCANYVGPGVCNWALGADDFENLCLSCRLTRVIPDLSRPGNARAWGQLESAKRRLLYSLLTLALPLTGKNHNAAQGLEFRFLSDQITPNGDSSRVLTGHDNGVITINVAEADDSYRESVRIRHGEPYRTLLGHFRHEVGHYFWDRLIGCTDRLWEFRRIFGDEREDYQRCLTRHYRGGAPAAWAERFVSAYASMHPWEDWAESWAHVMHMVDALETAYFLGLSVRPRRPDEPALSMPAQSSRARIGNADQLLKEWSTLTYVLNNLNRGLGLADAYVFVLSAPVAAKIRFICECMALEAQH